MGTFNCCDGRLSFDDFDSRIQRLHPIAREPLLVMFHQKFMGLVRTNSGSETLLVTNFYSLGHGLGGELFLGLSFMAIILISSSSLSESE